MTISYFQSYRNYFWEWEDAGDIVAIRHEKTIAYRSFIMEFIQRLAPQGLPTFGSLLLALVATNPEGEVSINHIRELIADRLTPPDQPTLQDALAFLKTLANIPPAYKKQDNRFLLMQAIFEGCHDRLSLKDSKMIAAACAQQDCDITKATHPVELMAGVIRRDFRSLAILNKKLGTVQDILALMAPLPHAEAPLLEPDPTPPLKDDFVGELLENEQTFHVGALVRWLWGGLSIPVHSALPSQQPLGGISDLSNKGNLDRLLLSEYAYDDLMLLSRLANQEALYLQREVPPAQQHLNRIILLDTSIRNWGNPKTLAFAIAVAIARHPKTDIVCTCFALTHQRYEPISLDSVSQLIDAQKIVDVHLDCADGLQSFLDNHQASDNQEIIYITEAAAFQQRSVVRVMQEYQDAFTYVMLTQTSGSVDIYKKQHRSRKLLQQIEVPLEELWHRSRNTSNTPPQPRGHDDSVPILISPGTISMYLTSTEEEYFLIDNEHNLLRHYHKKLDNKGWQLIYGPVPFLTQHLEIGRLDGGDYMLLLFNPQKKEITLINLSTKKTKTNTFLKWTETAWTSFGFCEGNFYHLSSEGRWCISPDGDIRTSDTGPDHNWFIQRTEQKKMLPKPPVRSINLLKNITMVFIGQQDDLVLNGHHKLTFHAQHLSFRPVKPGKAKCSASFVDRTAFRFDDGSAVHINRSGFLTLKSSNPDIPVIYIPSVLNASLCAATVDTFSGNTYYHRQALCQLKLVSPGKDKSALFAKISEQIDISIRDANDLFVQAPVNIPGTFPLEWGEKLKQTFEETGAKIELMTITNEQEQIGVQGFYTTYISRFIATIVNYGS